MAQPFKFSIIGVGNLGSSIARFLHELGASPYSIISKNQEVVEQLGYETHTIISGTKVDDLHRESTVIFLTVPDDQIGKTALALSKILFFDWNDVLVVHCSGSLSPSLLDPLRRLGATIGSLHPVQTFPTRKEPSSRFHQIYWGITGQPEVIAKLKDVVHLLKGSAVIIPENAKPIYHMACVMASNYMVTVVNMVAESLASCGLKREEAFKIIQPLLSGTLQNLTHLPIESALTGPIARGELSVLKTHVEELSYHLPHLLPVYAHLANETVRVAVKKGSISSTVANQIYSIFEPSLYPVEKSDPE